MFLLRDTFESFGWNVTTAGTGSSATICSQFTAVYNGRVYLDENVANLNAEDFDAVFLVSSEQWIPNPMGNILQSPDAIALFQQFSELDKGISTFCQGIRVFAQANIINGKTVTGPQSYYSDCVNRGATYLTNQNAPVKDGMMVTSRRARTNSVRIPEKLEKALQGN
ncbi:DJ-1/PfpI family protein [Bacteroidota bacterium]